MKQFITKEQWGEIGEEHQLILAKKFFNESDEIIGRIKSKKQGYESYFDMAIGQMIEFLGENDYIKAFIDCNMSDYQLDIPKDYIGVELDEICDNLWEAVKNKLKNN